jgi:hypothetical protein
LSRIIGRKYTFDFWKKCHTQNQQSNGYENAYFITFLHSDAKFSSKLPNKSHIQAILCFFCTQIDKSEDYIDEQGANNKN